MLTIALALWLAAAADPVWIARAAQVVSASPQEIDYVISVDSAAVTFTTASTNINVIAWYPNLYSADVMAPRLVTADDGTISLTVFGSGLGNATDWSASIGGVTTPVTAATSKAGVDQYTINVPATLIGQGPLDVVVITAGRPSNAVSVQF